MEAVSKIYLKLRYYFKLCRLNLDLKDWHTASEDKNVPLSVLNLRLNWFHEKLRYCMLSRKFIR